MIEFLKKRWLDVLLGLFLALMLFPQTRQPVQIFIQRIISTSPSIIKEENQEKLINYHLLFENSDKEIENLIDYENQVIEANGYN